MSHVAAQLGPEPEEVETLLRWRHRLATLHVDGLDPAEVSLECVARMAGYYVHGIALAEPLPRLPWRSWRVVWSE